MSNSQHSPAAGCRRPPYAVLTAAEALARNWRGYHLSRKADGVCVRRTWGGVTVWGDHMRDGSLQVWEIERAGGWRERDGALREVFHQVSGFRFQVSGVVPRFYSPLNAAPNWHRVVGPETLNLQPETFLERMIEAARRDHTPDVAVAKPLDAAFGVGLIKIKLFDTHDVTVTDTGGGQMSVSIAYRGADAGRVTVRSLAVRDRLRVGDVIEISGTWLPSGKFREPVFLRERPDKT